VKLLISCSNAEEVKAAVDGGADVIDVKNPKEGALGASFPWIIKQIQKVTPPRVEVSCALGDLPNLPGSVSLAALGAATLNVNYVKVGVGGVKTRDEAVFLLKNAVKAVKEYDSSIKVVAAGYADAERVDSINPLWIAEIAVNANADVAMIDTAVKDGKTLLTFLTNQQLKQIVNDSHERGLLVALAGSLKKEQLPTILSLDADIVGLRGAACTNSDRLNGQVTKERVQELVGILKNNQIKAALPR
jgi:uncharacterized protein (UPF0264 family)